jgi:uncharacterized protein (DUF1330 family)
MHTKSKIALTLIAGVALGAAAVQGLHAQAKPKAYLITESEILDQAALDSYMPGVTSALPAGGGRFLAGPGVTKATAIVGTAPQRFGIAEFDTVDQAQAWMKSPAREALAAQRNKAIKITRPFGIAGARQTSFPSVSPADGPIWARCLEPPWRRATN